MIVDENGMCTLSEEDCSYHSCAVKQANVERGVLIMNMNIPKNCCECPVNMDVCKRGYKYLLEHPELYDRRADDCPLVPFCKFGDQLILL